MAKKVIYIVRKHPPVSKDKQKLIASLLKHDWWLSPELVSSLQSDPEA